MAAPSPWHLLAHHRLLAWGVVVGVPLGVSCVLWWPVPLQLGTLRPLTAFADSHVWVFEHLYRWLTEGAALEPTCMAGYPVSRHFRPIAGLPALLYLPLRPLLGPLAAASLLQLLALPASSAAAYALLRRWTDAAPLTAAACACIYALSPHLLGTLSTGEISNTQAWIPPLFLLAMASGGWWAVGLVGATAALTSPYLALSLPLVGVGHALGAVWQNRPRWRMIVRQGLALAVLAASLLPAWFLYRPDRAGGGESVFQPERRVLMTRGPLPHPSPVAQLDQLVLLPERLPGSPFETVHVAYVGLPLVLAAAALLLLCLWRRILPPRGGRAGLALAVGGVLLAVGPYLAAGGHYLGSDGLRLAGPMALLEAMGWPTSIGGLYFRYVSLAVLGLVLFVAASLPARPAPLAAVGLLLAQLGVGVAASGPFWPRPSAPVAGVAWLEAQTEPGAVLELPLQGPTDAHLGQAALLRAVYHRRATTALPRAVMFAGDPTRRLWNDALARYGTDPQGFQEALRRAGIGIVLLPADLVRHTSPDLDTLQGLLGPPDLEGDLLGWSLGAATPTCIPSSSSPSPSLEPR